MKIVKKIFFIALSLGGIIYLLYASVVLFSLYSLSKYHLNHEVALINFSYKDPPKNIKYELKCEDRKAFLTDLKKKEIVEKPLMHIISVHYFSDCFLLDFKDNYDYNYQSDKTCIENVSYILNHQYENLGLINLFIFDNYISNYLKKISLMSGLSIPHDSLAINRINRLEFIKEGVALILTEDNAQIFLYGEFKDWLEILDHTSIINCKGNFNETERKEFIKNL